MEDRSAASSEPDGARLQLEERLGVRLQDWLEEGATTPILGGYFCRHCGAGQSFGLRKDRAATDYALQRWLAGEDLWRRYDGGLSLAFQWLQEPCRLCGKRQRPKPRQSKASRARRRR
jgi:hypothetical protein